MKKEEIPMSLMNSLPLMFILRPISRNKGGLEILPPVLPECLEEVQQKSVIDIKAPQLEHPKELKPLPKKKEKKAKESKAEAAKKTIESQEEDPDIKKLKNDLSRLEQEESQKNPLIKDLDTIKTEVTQKKAGFLDRLRNTVQQRKQNQGIINQKVPEDNTEMEASLQHPQISLNQKGISGFEENTIAISGKALPNELIEGLEEASKEIPDIKIDSFDNRLIRNREPIPPKMMLSQKKPGVLSRFKRKIEDKKDNKTVQEEISRAIDEVKESNLGFNDFPRNEEDISQDQIINSADISINGDGDKALKEAPLPNEGIGKDINKFHEDTSSHFRIFKKKNQRKDEDNSTRLMDHTLMDEIMTKETELLSTLELPFIPQKGGINKKLTNENKFNKTAMDKNYKNLKGPAGDSGMIYEEKSEVSQIRKMVLDSRSALIDLKLDDARKIYIEIIKLYNILSIKDKEIVYQDVLDLFNDRKNAEKINH